MARDSKLPADINVLNKTEAAAVLPDLFAAPAAPVEEAPATEEVQ